MTLFTAMMHPTSKQICIFNVGCIKHIIQLSKYNKWFMLEVEYAQAAATKNIIEKNPNNPEQISTTKIQSHPESSNKQLNWKVKIK